jgi:hypothetical protein
MSEEKLTIEKAREIVKEYTGWTAEDEYDFAAGFIEGHESRQAEIEELKKEIKDLLSALSGLEAK